MFVDKTVAPTISIFKRALQLCGQFTREWIEIPNNYRDKLYGQILQPPLDAVLEEVKKDADELGESGVCKSRHIQNITGYLKDFHMNEFLLNRHPVLKGAEPREVSIKHPSGRCTQCIQPIIYKDCGNSSNKIVYLCLNCFKEVPLSATESFEDFRTSTILLFCSTKCERDMKAKVSGGAARRQLMRRDRGICSMCKLDCAKLIRKLQSIEKGPETDSEGNLLWKLQREDLLSRAEYRNFTSRLSKAMKEALIDKALSGKAWQADHIVPVFEGGGQCTVTNLRTLCTACHKDVTAAQASKRQKERALLKRQRQGKMTNARMNEQGGIALGISRLNQGKQQSQDMDSTAGQTREFLKSVQQRKRKYGAESSARV
jgi:5-methylcytosine-specific restriction endonuclease McrA